ncbi:MAG TPA: hypothetical protein VF230_03560 [Acidimicrobiales bacterium]
MTAPTPAVALRPTPTFAEIARRFPEWVQKNVVATVVSAAISGVIGYVVNVWLMAVRYEGSVTPAGTPATSKDNVVAGGLFWALLPMLICSIVGYRRAVGRERFWRDVRGLPTALVALVRRDGARGRAHLLWGAAVALAAGLIVSPAVGAVLGVGLLVSAPSVLGQMVASLVGQVYQRILGRAAPATAGAPAAPAAQAGPPVMSAAVGVLGGAIALTAGFLLPGRGMRILLALACAAGAFYLGQQLKASTAAALVVLFGAAALAADAVFASPAFADDGGFAECGSSLSTWIENCAGAGEVRRLAGSGGVIAGIAGPLGTFIGGLVAGFVGPGGGPWWEGGGGEGEGGGTATDPDAPPTDYVDPQTGEPLVTNDGRWPDVPEGYVWHQGEWKDPASIGAVEVDDEDRPDRYHQGDRPQLVDPVTRKPLPVDIDGKVQYGKEWLTPEEAAERIKIDAENVEGRRAAQDLIDQVKAINARLDAPWVDEATKAELRDELRKRAIEINSNYDAKSILKADKSGIADVLDAEVQKIYGDVDPRFADIMEQMGVTRGGRPFNEGDMWDVRNQSSKGLGMDRDFALDERKILEIKDKLAAAEPGSKEADDLWKELKEARKSSQLEIDAERYAEFLAGKARTASTPAERAQIEAKVTQIQAEIEAGVRRYNIDPSTWNTIARDAYGRAYGEVTGTDADKALQGVTQQFNDEAYGDRNALLGDPSTHPLNRDFASQTASVSTRKTFHNEELVERGLMTPAQAIMEDARGFSKDMSTKLLPLLAADPNVDPARLERLRVIQETMKAIGDGTIPPSQADGYMRAATGDPTMDLEKAMRVVDANLEMGIKMHQEGPRPAPTDAERAGVTAARTPTAEPAHTRATYGDAFGKATDLATFDSYYKQHLANGMSEAEAAALATTQLMAGNAATSYGAVNPTLSMVAGTMLPGGMGNILPDQMAENTAATTWEAGKALVSDLGTSVGSGELSTEAIDKFAESVANRGNADPFGGYGQAAQLAGDLSARTDGGSLAGDLQQIYETGAGTEVLNESMASFQDQVESGQHGVVLEGLDAIASAGSELLVSPTTTVSQFVDDVSNIITHGVGDDFWDQAGTHTKEVIDKTPVIGMVANGYEAIAEGVGESGVSGFATEMGEGAIALGGEAVSAVADAGSSAVRFIKGFF